MWYRVSIKKGVLSPLKKQKKGTLRQEDRGRPAGGALSV
ncbi:hypothetical protein PORUE0001_1162 [Porphyromonas uenonis 60-3]|uniref:Uncharacterized protein n=1 Tax=Porphyromonas uenonis 60-3 TaxID=596327 RepID=C2MAM8_9PORP|nr:hypothetical protein PORUE0001_1162 [Porphyromonas uenonis 60-3]